MSNEQKSLNGNSKRGMVIIIISGEKSRSASRSMESGEMGRGEEPVSRS